MILTDYEIKNLSEKFQMINPFDETRLTKIENKISWGVSSCGYDMRLDSEFYVFKNKIADTVIDPKKFELSKLEKVVTDECVVPPKSYVLTKSLEYFKIPRDVIVIVFGKSTYARCGLIVNVTPLEPEWEGFVTISIINPLDCGIKIYAKEGIAQLIFLKSDNLCEISYKDKSGKYQAQKHITLPKV